MGISILIVFICFIIAFFGIRDVCFTIIHYLMNKNAYRKRKKGMTFKEWFTLSRFRLEIPRYHIVFYYFTMVLYAIILIGFIIMHATGIISEFKFLRIGLLVFTLLYGLLYSAAFFGIHWGHTWLYKRYKIKFRGVDKKAYMEKRRKYNRVIKKGEDNENNKIPD